ncbi:hypothetical protein [Microbacterium sp. No. 7]|uniref:hypothetical protein n=1 Tax=Microbacterium sp. No. 7 TaxID=1714373 RepID=UPI003FA57AD8
MEAHAARAVERGRRFDRWIPGILLDSPISRLGYLAGTAFGFVWGTLWSTGRVERRAGLWGSGGCRGSRSAAAVSASGVLPHRRRPDRRSAARA